MTDTVPPQSLEAEEHVLGAMLLSPRACDTVTDILEPADFYRESHAIIYQAALKLHADGVEPDAVALADALEQDGSLDRVGGRVRLHELGALGIVTPNVAHWARIVRECAVDRALIRAGSEIARLGWERTGESAERMDKAESLVYELGNRAGMDVDLDPGIRDYVQTLTRLRENPGELIGVPSGFHVLDEITQGFVPGNLIVVGARPSMGKSALGLCVAANLIGMGRPVGVVSLEMSKPEIDQRLVSLGANVPGEKLRNPRKLTPEEWQRVLDAAARLEQLPLYVREAGAMTPLEVRAQIRRLKAKVPDLALVVVDYLQLMTTGNDNRVQEVSEISRALKQTARDLNVPVMALSQLSRALEQRVDKRPILSDLRESGSIEQDADVVLFLYRDSYYHPPEVETVSDWVEVNVAKHRNGPTDRVRLVFVREQARFSNPAPPRLAGDMGMVA